MTRAKRSKHWLQSHARDTYVKQAQQAGYRSRAAYKLIELDRSDRLFKPGMTVVDLGAAPGGWAQVAAERVGRAGRVIAVDLLVMDPLPGVEVIQGDVTEPDVLAWIKDRLGPGEADLVISDMAPNISGRREVDQANILCLNEMTLEFSQEVLKTGGGMLVKTFHGEGFDALREQARRGFRRVTVRKPKASRSHSSEVYLLGHERLHENNPH